MIIIGITGGIGHGKTTLSNALAALEIGTCQFETYQLVAEVANKLHLAASMPKNTHLDELNEFIRPLPGIIKDITGTDCEFEKLRITPKNLAKEPELYEKLVTHINNLVNDPQLLEQPITASNKGKYRPILQWLGGYLVAKIDKDIWYRELLLRAKKAPCKLAIIGGVRFPSDEKQVHAAQGIILEVIRPGYRSVDLKDPTERERKQIKSDSKIINNGTIADLEKCASYILSDIKSGRLKAKYKTA